METNTQTIGLGVRAGGKDNAVAEHFRRFDQLDFDVFSNKKWDQLHLSHSQDVVVHWPDGHVTKGIEQHIKDLAAMAEWTPDMNIMKHPVSIGADDWTSVIGEMKGTFSKPMAVGPGKKVPPTGKSYTLAMCTVGHWTKEGPMDEEFLFWDSGSFMKQIGL